MSRQLLPFPSKNETSLSFTIENDDDDDYEGKNYFLTGNYLSKKKNDSFLQKKYDAFAYSATATNTHPCVLLYLEFGWICSFGDIIIEKNMSFV